MLCAPPPPPLAPACPLTSLMVLPSSSPPSCARRHRGHALGFQPSAAGRGDRKGPCCHVLRPHGPSLTLHPTHPPAHPPCAAPAPAPGQPPSCGAPPASAGCPPCPWRPCAVGDVGRGRGGASAGAALWRARVPPRAPPPHPKAPLPPTLPPSQLLLDHGIQNILLRLQCGRQVRWAHAVAQGSCTGQAEGRRLHLRPSRPQTLPPAATCECRRMVMAMASVSFSSSSLSPEDASSCRGEAVRERKEHRGARQAGQGAAAASPHTPLCRAAPGASSAGPRYPGGLPAGCRRCRARAAGSRQPPLPPSWQPTRAWRCPPWRACAPRATRPAPPAAPPPLPPPPRSWPSWQGSSALGCGGVGRAGRRLSGQCGAGASASGAA